jgi:hypothetical protein
MGLDTEMKGCSCYDGDSELRDSYNLLSYNKSGVHKLQGPRFTLRIDLNVAV